MKMFGRNSNKQGCVVSKTGFCLEYFELWNNSILYIHQGGKVHDYSQSAKIKFGGALRDVRRDTSSIATCLIES
jgi:hypothetical protein